MCPAGAGKRKDIWANVENKSVSIFLQINKHCDYLFIRDQIDCSNSIANALELFLSCAKPSKCILNHASTYNWPQPVDDIVLHKAVGARTV